MTLSLAEEPTTLRVFYETDALLPASDVAAVLKEVSTAFERYAKRRGRYRSLRLAVKRVELSSLLVDFVAMSVETGRVAVEHREALYGFIGFIANTLSIAKGLGLGKAKPADLRMIDALQKPVAKAGAQQVNIFITGDSNVVTIDHDAIQLIQTHREEKEIAKVDPRLTKVVGVNHVRPDETPRILTLNGKSGTVFDVKGEWYVRLEGEGGVLNPLKLAPDVKVADGQAYQFDGEWDDRRYRIRAARPLR